MSSTARRVGSARAWKVASGEYVTERFRIMRNYKVTDWRLSSEKFGKFFFHGRFAGSTLDEVLVSSDTNWAACSGPQRLAQVRGDLFAVEAAVLDEDLAGARPGHDHTGHVDTRDVA